MSVFWRMLDLCLLLAALSAVPGPAHGMDFRLGVLLEDGSSVSADLINKTVSRIVNDDWMYFSAGSNRRMVLEIAAVPPGKTVQAVQKVCTWHNVSALLAVGSCELAVCARDLGKSLGVPTVVVPVGLCDVAIDSNFVAAGREPISHQVAAAVAAIEFEKVTEIALVYDETQDSQMVQDFVTRITAKKVACSTFLAGAGNASQVARSLTAGSARLVAAMLTKERLREVLLAANATGAIRVDYQWLALDPGVNAAQLLSWLPTAGFPVNLLIIRSPTWGLATTPDTCIDQLTAVVPGCRGDSLTVAQLQAADSVLAVATALLSLNASDSASESRVTCGLPGSWPGGAAVARALKSGTAPVLGGHNVSYSAADSHALSPYIELISTHSAAFGDRPTFVESGRFNSATGRLSVTFADRQTQQKLLFANKFLSFKGRVLNVCSPAINPYTVYTNASNGFGGKVVEGYNADLLSVLESSLNFRSLVRPPSLASSSSGSQADCIADILNGKADIALLFGLNSGSYSSVEFSNDILPMSHTILVKRPAQGTALWNVFLPFTYDVWLLLLGMFIVVSMILYVLAYFNPFSAWNLGLPFAIADEIWYKEYVWSLVGSFLQQGQDFFPFAASPRTILAFWWLFTVIIFGTYTGELAAQLTITVQRRPVKSLSELADDPLYKVHVVTGSGIHQSILRAETGSLAELRHKLEPVANEASCAETVMYTDNPYQVCIMDQNMNAYYANNFCNKAYVTNDYFNPSFNGLVFPKNAFYTAAFNGALQRAKETGIANLIRLKHFPVSNPECHVPEIVMTTAAINLEGIGGTCFLTIGLYIMAMFVLGVELCWTNVCKKNPLDFMCF